jgi:hypothetical protein
MHSLKFVFGQNLALLQKVSTKKWNDSARDKSGIYIKKMANCILIVNALHIKKQFTNQ